MTTGLNYIKDKVFFRLLFGKTAFTLLAVLGVAIIYIVLMSTINHRELPFSYIVLTLAIIKTWIISSTTLKQLSKLIKICQSLEQLLWVFGLLIMISLLSFATDYTCLYQFDPQAFEGVPTYSDSYIYNLYHFFYFSVITFSTVGYGDIVPSSDIARFVVMLETFLSFFIIVFALTNIKKIHIQ